MAEWPLRGRDVAGDLLLMITLCLYACVYIVSDCVSDERLCVLCMVYISFIYSYI